MKKISFFTLGCKVNTYESNALMNLFEKEGFEVIEPCNLSDVFVINTCSVTNQADAKSRKMISKAKSLNPNALIAVIGCYAQTSGNVEKIDGIDIILGNGNKKELIPLVKEKLYSNNPILVKNIMDLNNNRDYELLEVTSFDQTRAYVKIEDGCNNFCSYCIIPFARGRERSKPSLEVISEIKRIVALGYKEVVLAGIHTGKYNDNGLNLSDLIELILKEVQELDRLRLSSIEINEIDDKMLSIMADSKVFASHLHLPLQSGSDKILKLMNRRYDTKYYREKINKIRKINPYISITTDVIVGFPYETEEDFIDTMNYCKEINFSKIHVFPYSKRSGTKAFSMPQVNDFEKKKRTLKLIDLSNELEHEYESKFLNHKLDIIVESTHNDDYMVGHSSNYLRILIPMNKKLIGKIVKIEVIKIEDNLIYGEIIND